MASTLTPDQIAALLKGLTPGQQSVDLGNGQSALVNWQYGGGENGQYSNPTISGYATPTNGNDGSATNYNIYDPTTGGLKQNYQTGSIDKYALAPFLAAGAGLALAGGLGGLGAGASGAGATGATVAGNAAAMTVPTEATWAAGADALGQSLSPYLASGAAGAAGGAAGAASAGGGGLVDSGIGTMAPLSTAGTVMPASLTAGMGGTGGLLGSIASALGIPTSALAGLAGLAGAAAGSQGVKSTQNVQKDIPDWLKPYVTAPGGVLDSANKLLQQQMQPGAMAGYDQMKSVGQGLLSQPIAGNGFSKLFPNGMPSMPQMPAFKPYTSGLLK